MPVPWTGRVPRTGRVLRTVMVVAYARAFHKGDFPLDRDTCKPADSALGELHEDLIRRWRDKVYAHTDKVGGRTAAITPRTETLGRIIGFSRNDFPMARLDEALTLFAVQRKRFEHEAESLQLTLDGELASGS